MLRGCFRIDSPNSLKGHHEVRAARFPDDMSNQDRLTPGDLVGSLTKTDAAYQTLRSWIEDGRLPPGARLKVGALARQMAFSPTPVREALRLLQADGVADNRPHKGMIVAEYPIQTVEETFALRALLEPVAVEWTAQNASEQQISQIAKIHSQFVRSVASGSMQLTAAKLNAEWHRALAESCGSRLLGEFIMRLWSTVPMEAMWLSANGAASVAEHSTVMEALVQRNSTASSAAMKRHIVAGLRRNRDRPTNTPGTKTGEPSARPDSRSATPSFD